MATKKCSHKDFYVGQLFQIVSTNRAGEREVSTGQWNVGVRRQAKRALAMCNTSGCLARRYVYYGPSGCVKKTGPVFTVKEPAEAKR
jgi:hypothetical protein